MLFANKLISQYLSYWRGSQHLGLPRSEKQLQRFSEQLSNGGVLLSR